MKSLATTLTLLALVALPFTAMAQPTVNGNTSDNEYFTLGTMTEAGMGFGDFGLIDLRAYQDGSKLYIALTGTAEAESNFNTFVVYIDVVGSTAGVTAGNQLRDIVKSCVRPPDQAAILSG